MLTRMQHPPARRVKKSFRCSESRSIPVEPWEQPAATMGPRRAVPRLGTDRQGAFLQLTLPARSTWVVEASTSVASDSEVAAGSNKRAAEAPAAPAIQPTA